MGSMLFEEKKKKKKKHKYSDEYCEHKKRHKKRSKHKKHHHYEENTIDAEESSNQNCDSDMNDSSICIPEDEVTMDDIIEAQKTNMHGSAGLHSAMAIKRQRRMREQAKRRAMERDRRLSSHTSSMDSMEHLPTKNISHSAPPDHRLATSISMLHIGVCFLVFGLFLIGSGLLPDDMVTWRRGGWWNELLATGIFVAALGIFLIALNRVMSRREEDDLNEYVSRQLTRSRSGHRLERDVETGCLTTKNHRRILEKKREDEERGFTDITPVHSPLAKVAPPNPIQNGDASCLEKIVEEDVFERITEDVKPFEKETMSTTTTASLSPGTPSETRELISTTRQYSFNSRQY